MFSAIKMSDNFHTAAIAGDSSVTRRDQFGSLMPMFFPFIIIFPAIRVANSTSNETNHKFHRRSVLAICK